MRVKCLVIGEEHPRQHVGTYVGLALNEAYTKVNFRAMDDLCKLEQGSCVHLG